MSFSKRLYVLQRGIINILWWFLDPFFLALMPNKLSTQNNLRKRVLIIRIDALGDFVIWSSTFKAIQQRYPSNQYELTLLGNSGWTSLASEFGVFNQVLGLDRKMFLLNPRYRFNKIHELTNLNAFDTIYYHTYSREFGSGDLLIHALKAKNKIGIESDKAIDTAFWHRISNGWYTQLLKPYSKGIHELWKHEAFMQHLGVSNFTINLPEWNTIITRGKQVRFEYPYYVVFCGARVGIRKWPAEKYASICTYLYEHYKLQGVICGSAAENIDAELILQNTSAPIVNMCGQSTLKELVQIIASSMFLVGNETSGIHIAIACKVPTVCITGGGHFGRFVPYPPNFLDDKTPHLVAHKSMTCYHCDWNCIYQVSKNKPVPCITEISVENVCEQVQKVVKATLSSK